MHHLLVNDDKAGGRRGWRLPLLLFAVSLLAVGGVWAAFGALHQAVAGTQARWDGDYTPTPTVLLTIVLPAAGLTAAALEFLSNRGRWRP
jgi:hypothetical protein